MKRGAVKKRNGSKAVIVWFPDSLLAGLNTAVTRTDLDKSKFIRAAVREKIATLKLP